MASGTARSEVRRHTDEAIDRRIARIERFASRYRPYVEALSSISPEVEDLADSFPALLFALVSGYGTERTRRHALELVIEGASLKKAAAALGLPMWLRHLPAEAFGAPLADLPSSEEFVRVATTVAAAGSPPGPHWLRQIGIAARGCHEQFATWVAACAHPSLTDIRDAEMRVMAAWAWHGGAPGTPGHALICRPWNARMSPMRAVMQARQWLRFVAFEIRLQVWSQLASQEHTEVDALVFVPLRSAGDFVNEARLMANCLDRYLPRLVANGTFVISIRRRGTPIADMEVSRGASGRGKPRIVQLRGPNNRRVDARVSLAAHRWLETAAIGLQELDEHSHEMRLLSAADAFWSSYLRSVPPAHAAQFAYDLQQVIPLRGSAHFRRPRMTAEHLALLHEAWQWTDPRE